MDKKGSSIKFNQKVLTGDWRDGIKDSLVRFKWIYFTGINIFIASRSQSLGSEYPAVVIGRADGESSILVLVLLLPGVVRRVGPGVNCGVDHHGAEAAGQEILLILLSEEVAVSHVVRPVD